ncbi:MAG TPA: TRAP transporter large permease subunit [Syntrophorhabdaceae bacterium]|jgi:C4-dicarboxylate transporter DctM subunit|nr:TRAP transporter large permease subunit [Syntrophorhabdaceae bacterium]HNT67654.1 TRAP transporter large permease subunit [Syntrophorhabdaceae bacterium]
MTEGIWVFPLLLVLLLFGLPIGIALFTSALLALLVNNFDVMNMAHTMYQTLDSFLLSSLPLFMLMANILFRANIGEDLFELLNVFLRRIRGGLSLSALAACGLFAAISGSSAATVLTIGIVAIPAMLSRGYDRKLVFGALGSGGLLGVLIPPSGWMIIYGDIAEVSVGKLFLAGVIPGLILLGIFLIVAYIQSIRTRMQPMEPATWPEKKAALRRAFPAIWLPPIILGGIYSGIFTPTESAAVGCVYAAAISVRRLKIKDFWPIFKDTVVATSMLFLVIKTAVVFGSSLTMMQIPQKLAAIVVQAGLTPIPFIIVMSLVYFVLGLFVDGICMLLLTLPIILPILGALNIDLIWFCIIVVVNMEIGCISPPFGVNLFVLMGIVKDAELPEILHGLLPFFLGLVAFLIIVISFPALSTWLPAFLK